jgi:cardiolipin synthase (CMP-forming)
VVNARPTEPVMPEVVDHSRDIYTVANIVTILRLILVPFFFAVLIETGNDLLSFTLYAIAASTDWVDGQIARRSGTVTELGKAIDPLADRLLIAAGVLGLYLIGRIPGWMVIVLVARDVYLLGGAYVLARNQIGQLPVVFIGKLTTALLLFGFSDLILNWPQVPGLGLVTSPALPGFGAEPVALGMWFVYAGTATSLITMATYTVQARTALSRARTQTT